MSDEPERSREARAAAEAALVGVVHHYGARPEFVLIGGLVPEILCANSPVRHAGTTDVDVQVNIEVASGSIHTRRLELALRDAGCRPDNERIWRWTAEGATPKGHSARGSVAATTPWMSTSPGWPGSYWQRQPLPTPAASRRIGTTSRSCFCTTTSVGFPKLPGLLWRVSVIAWTLVPSWPIAIPQNSISSGGVPRNSDTVFERALPGSNENPTKLTETTREVRHQVCITTASTSAAT